MPSTITIGGHVVGNARTAFEKLSANRKIVLIEKAQISHRLLDSRPQLRDALAQLGEGVEQTVLVADTGVYACAVGPHGRWYLVLDCDGSILSELQEVTKLARAACVSTREIRYGVQDSKEGPALGNSGATERFDSKMYLEAAYKFFREVRYAGLAATGLRFKSLTLDQLYVDASAQEEADVVSEAQLKRAVDDALQGMKLEPALRSRLEEQLRLTLNIRMENPVLGAAELYQKSGSVLVVGDPGAGKTCFTRSELLKYCRQYGTKDGWYSRHLPIYLQLADAARAYAPETAQDILEMAVEYSARNGFGIPYEVVQTHRSAGLLALFLDGFDEIVQFDFRERVVEFIATYVRSSSPLGNRLIVTSRPGALDLFAFPQNLSRISLNGLDVDSMRVLARRVLTLRATGGEYDIAHQELSRGDEEIIEKLVLDCQTTSGIGRIARNPLLCTLLIMIYANSGAPSAKRHRVYRDAVQTLISVRTRESKHKAYSEADLRSRLGSIALHALEDELTTVPMLDDAVRWLRKIVPSFGDEQALKYLQDLSEATGIIRIHRRSDGGQPAVSFMHYSFMEYYAALGLLQLPDPWEAAIRAARKTRWLEVVSLFAGVYSTVSDPAEFIRRLLASQTDGERLSLEVLHLAADCALETDVPSDATFDAILTNVRMEFGAVLGAAGDARREIGKLLGRLYDASGDERIDHFIRDELVGGSLPRCAVAIEVLAALTKESAIEPKASLAAFQSIVESPVPSALVSSVCEAFVASPAFRTKGSRRVVAKGLRGSRETRLVALRAVSKESGSLGIEHSAELDTLVRGSDFSSRVAASQALIASFASRNIAALSDVDARRLAAAAGVFTGAVDLQTQRGMIVRIDNDALRPLLASTDPAKRSLGLAIAPWTAMPKTEVYRHARECLLSRDPTAVKAALACLGTERQIVELVGVDVESAVVGLLDDKRSDVRVAASRLLGKLCAVREFGTHAEAGLLVTLTNSFKNAKPLSEERADHANALASGARNDGMGSDIAHMLDNEIVQALVSTRRVANRDRFVQKIFVARRQLDIPAHEHVTSRLFTAVRDRRFPSAVKREILLTVAATMAVTQPNVGFLCDYCRTEADTARDGAISAINILVHRVRLAPKVVRQVPSLTTDIHDILVALGAPILHGMPQSLDGASARMLRESIRSISSIASAMKEFSTRSRQDVDV